jgi:hypothetical protein
MHTELIKVPREEATLMYRKYKEHVNYAKPIDWEIQRCYQLLARGKVIIRAIESIKQAGLNREYLPKLAIAPATSAACHLRRNSNGSMVMSPDDRFHSHEARNIRFNEDTFAFPAESFPIASWNPKIRISTDHKAIMPLIPVHLRPKRGMENYSVLWEAEWKRVIPVDPFLLRRIGKSDLWLVVAHWDLTAVEQGALSTRV